MPDEAMFRALAWVLLAGVAVMRLVFAGKVRRAGERLMPDRAAIRREGRVAFAARAVVFVLLLAFLVAYAVDAEWMAPLSLTFPGWLRGTGFAVGLVSLAFWTWAQATLGTAWSPQLQLRSAHRLVTSGPYARIRHPIYAAMVGFSAGLALVTANVVFVSMTALVVAGLAVRVPKEEQMMRAEFGADYDAYVRRTGRFLPRP